MVRIIGVVVVVVSVIGHRVADRGAADPAYDRPDRTANSRSANGARDPSADRAGFVRKGLPTRNSDKGCRAQAKQKSRHGSILRFGERRLQSAEAALSRYVTAKTPKSSRSIAGDIASGEIGLLLFRLLYLGPPVELVARSADGYG
jgi:hypothetical protein